MELLVLVVQKLLFAGTCRGSSVPASYTQHRGSANSVDKHSATKGAHQMHPALVVKGGFGVELKVSCGTSTPYPPYVPLCNIHNQHAGCLYNVSFHRDMSFHSRESAKRELSQPKECSNRRHSTCLSERELSDFKFIHIIGLASFTEK